MRRRAPVNPRCIRARSRPHTFTSAAHVPPPTAGLVVVTSNTDCWECYSTWIRSWQKQNRSQDQLVITWQRIHSCLSGTPCISQPASVVATTPAQHPAVECRLFHDVVVSRCVVISQVVPPRPSGTTDPAGCCPAANMSAAVSRLWRGEPRGDADGRSDVCELDAGSKLSFASSTSCSI